SRRGERAPPAAVERLQVEQLSAGRDRPTSQAAPERDGLTVPHAVPAGRDRRRGRHAHGDLLLRGALAGGSGEAEPERSAGAGGHRVVEPSEPIRPDDRDRSERAARARRPRRDLDRRARDRVAARGRELSWAEPDLPNGSVRRGASDGPPWVTVRTQVLLPCL